MGSIKELELKDGLDEFDAEMSMFFTRFRHWKMPMAMFEKAWQPKCDVYESDGEYIVLLELSGVKKDDVEVTVEGKRVIISGHRKRVVNDKYRVRQLEVPYGDFERTITFVGSIDIEASKAVYKEGFLIIHIRKV